jgi:hypothetical protein
LTSVKASTVQYILVTRLEFLLKNLFLGSQFRQVMQLCLTPRRSRDPAGTSINQSTNRLVFIVWFGSSRYYQSINRFGIYGLVWIQQVYYYQSVNRFGIHGLVWIQQVYYDQSINRIGIHGVVWIQQVFCFFNPVF